MRDLDWITASPEVNFLNINSAISFKSEIFISFDKFPDFLPISYSLPEVNLLVPKVCRFEKKIPIWSKFSDLKKWANGPAQAGSKK